MGRSVSCASGSIHIAYSHIEREGDEEAARDDWEWYCDSFKQAMCKAFPSLDDYDKWLGRENHVLLANNFAYFGVSEYCGLVSMWVAPVEPSSYEPWFDSLRDRWIEQIGSRFYETAAKCFGEPLSLDGFMSNGVGVYRKIA